MSRHVQTLDLGVAAALFLMVAGCSTNSSGSPTPRAPEVQVIQVQQRDVPLYQEWIGTLDGLVNADIKSQVSGYLVAQSYTEGTFVSKGQVLFEIDPRPFKATLDQTQGQLAQSEGLLAQARAQLLQDEAQIAVAEANHRRTQLDVDRYTPLAQQNAVTQQDLDNATQNNLAAKGQLQAAKARVETTKAQITAAQAAVQTAKASVETADINLGFTRITSPIEGIPGIAQQQIGALVSPASGLITTVSTLDPIKVYFTASEQEYIDFARRFPTAELRQADLKQVDFELILADGIPYPHKGRFSFADRQVDVRTGAIRVAVEFPNPGNNLRPGLYGRVRATLNTKQDALLVPQRAVIDLQGSRQLAIVQKDNTVRIRPVKVSETVGSEWIVEEGVTASDIVIVEGAQKVREGMKISPKPYVQILH